MGATGSKLYPWTTKRELDLGRHQVTHSFLVIPECPAPLLGRDLTKLKARIQFTPTGPPEVTWGEAPITCLTVNLEEEYRLYECQPDQEIPSEWLIRYPELWAESSGVGMAKRIPPVVVGLKADAMPILVRRYPMSREAKEGIQHHIYKLIQQGILVCCQSPWNTPLLPVWKPGNCGFCPVQDLRKVNWRVQDLHPYNFLSSLPPERVWYTVLDLKDAFFCLRLHPNSQPLFAFEWRDLEGGQTGQLT